MPVHPRLCPHPRRLRASRRKLRRDRVKQFVRVNAPQNDETKPAQARTPTPPPRPAEPPPAEKSKPFIKPIADRAEPFIGPTHRAPEPPPLRAVPSPTPAADWRDDDEPGFAAKPCVAHPESANEAFPVIRESRDAPARGSASANAGARGSRKGWRIAGIVMAVLLALLLIVQVAWWQREEVMVLVPGTHSLYVDVCDQLGCTIAPPRDIDGLQIESSGLRQIDGSAQARTEAVAAQPAGRRARVSGTGAHAARQ